MANSLRDVSPQIGTTEAEIETETEIAAGQTETDAQCANMCICVSQVLDPFVRWSDSIVYATYLARSKVR